MVNRRVLLTLVAIVGVVGTAVAVMMFSAPLQDGGGTDGPANQSERGDTAQPVSEDDERTTGEQNGGEKQSDDILGHEAGDGSATPGLLDAPTKGFAGFVETGKEIGLDYTPQWEPTFGTGREGPYIVDFNLNGYEDILLVGGDQPVLFENAGGEYERAQTFDHENVVSAHFFITIAVDSKTCFWFPGVQARSYTRT